MPVGQRDAKALGQPLIVLYLIFRKITAGRALQLEQSNVVLIDGKGYQDKGWVRPSDGDAVRLERNVRAQTSGGPLFEIPRPEASMGCQERVKRGTVAGDHVPAQTDQRRVILRTGDDFAILVLHARPNVEERREITVFPNFTTEVFPMLFEPHFYGIARRKIDDHL
jgi:hypothetical protein